MATQGDNKMKTGALMMVGGGIIGAGMALLLAPQTGKKTCKDIARYARKIGRKTNDAVYDFADSISEFTDTVGEKAADILQAGQDMTPEAKKQLLAAIEKGQEKLEKQKSRLARLIG